MLGADVTFALNIYYKISITDPLILQAVIMLNNDIFNLFKKISLYREGASVFSRMNFSWICSVYQVIVFDISTVGPIMGTVVQPQSSKNVVIESECE